MSSVEVRHFLASAAEYVYVFQHIPPFGGIVPPQIVPSEQGGKHVITVGDSWDHNARMVDGNKPTHAMTSIIMQPVSDADVKCPRIPRSDKCTLKLYSIPGGSLSRVVHCEKPMKRPEPYVIPPL